VDNIKLDLKQYGLYSFGSEQGQAVGSCEHGSETLDSIMNK